MQENTIITIKRCNHDILDINYDYTLPDYINDVRKVVRCNSKFILHNTYRNDSIMTFEGEVSYAILVLCEDDSLKNIIYSEDVSINSSVSEISDSFVYDFVLENSTARLLSPRKINCKSKVSVVMRHNAVENISPVFSGEGMPEAQYTIESRREKCSYMSLKESCVMSQHISRDIELSTDKEEIANIVYCNVETVINEQKVADGKLYLRGEGVTEILYESVNSNYKKIQEKFPFSEIIEDECIADGYICDIIIGDIKATVRDNTFGEMRLIELDYTYDIKCRGYCEHTAEFITDLYSTEYDVECRQRDNSHYKLNRVFSSSLSVNDSRSLEEYTDEGLYTVIDCNAAVISFNVDCNADTAKTTITGDIRFDIVCKGDGYHHASIVQPYRYERDYDGKTNDIYEEHIIKVLSTGAMIDKGRLIINAELYFSVMLAETVKRSFIYETEFEQCGTNNKSPIIIYYPKQGDTLWGVAKKFKSTCRDICTVNSMTGDSLEGIKVLLLPKKNQKSIFNSII